MAYGVAAVASNGENGVVGAPAISALKDGATVLAMHPLNHLNHLNKNPETLKP